MRLESLLVLILFCVSANRVITNFVRNMQCKVVVGRTICALNCECSSYCFMNILDVGDPDKILGFLRLLLTA